MPSPWKKQDRGLTGAQLTKAYLSFFEPDVIVEAASGLAAQVGLATADAGPFDQNVVQLKHFVDLQDDGSVEFAFGINVFDLYRQLYEREFQFAPRHTRKVASVTGTGRDAALVEALYGSFPSDVNLSHIGRAYADAFSPETIPINATSWQRILEEHFLTPLYFTRHDLKRSYESLRGPTLFIFDPATTIDLIDLWNLRQFQREVVPVSIHWVRQLRDFLRTFIERTYRPLPGNRHGVMIDTTVELARSLDLSSSQSLITEVFEGLPPGSWSLKQWYEPLWRQSPEDIVFRARRIRLAAKEVDVDLPLSGEGSASIAFNSIGPDFADDYGGRSARWVNVLTPRYVDTAADVALALPPDFPDLARMRTIGRVLATREGFVLPLHFSRLTERLSIPNGSDAIATWLRSKGIAVEKSSAGRTADQILGAVGGVRGAALLEDKETLELLDKMAKSTRRESDGAVSEYPDRTSPVAEWGALLNRRDAQRRAWRVSLDDFVKAGALRLGLSLQCPKCRSRNWYGLVGLADSLQCDRCLQNFAFPQGTLKFKNTPWHYRVAGPFAVPDFAGGAYATVLTLRVFATKLGFSLDAITTQSTNLELKKNGQHLEIDFALWFSRERRFHERDVPQFVVGEAKSFASDAMGDRDLGRLKRVAIELPGTFLVCSSMKGQLSDEETKRLRRLAQWGREPMASGMPRAPVIVLTGKELFAKGSVSDAWRESGGKAAALVTPGYVRTDNLWRLADLTQQIYLGLPAYDEWRLAKRIRKITGVN